MKKLFSIILVTCLLLSLAACGGAPSTTPTNGSSTQSTVSSPSVEDNFTFTYKGTEITLHASAEPIIAALGEPVKYTESTSCAFDGLDKTYYYGSFYLETYPIDGKDFISGWWFADDSITTPEGIYIGSAQADVEKAYGADTYNGSNAFTVTKDAGVLTIILEEGLVSSIQYVIKQS